MWTNRIGNADISPNNVVVKEWTKWTDVPLQVRQKLQEAVPLATEMVNAAITAVKRHLRADTAQFPFLEHGPGPGRLQNDRLTNLDKSEVGQGLIKYFNLKCSEPNYWTYVFGILRTFMEMKAGLANPGGYKLILANLNAKEDVKQRGQIARYGQETARVAEADEFRRRFGFATNRYGWVDEHGHYPYYIRYKILGDIEISYEWVKTESDASAIARTIVHEASHKWAFTDDVLYKHECFAKLPSDNEDKKNYGKLQEHIKIPGRDDLSPMMAMEMDENDKLQLITVERFLENADSYAWFARRMWKRGY